MKNRTIIHRIAFYVAAMCELAFFYVFLWPNASDHLKPLALVSCVAGIVTFVIVSNKTTSRELRDRNENSQLSHSLALLGITVVTISFILLVAAVVFEAESIRKFLLVSSLGFIIVAALLAEAYALCVRRPRNVPPSHQNGD
jgi:uncharacterized membrane protein YkgB